MEVTLGGVAGPVYGVLGGVIFRIETGFDDVAAAESPGGAGDFGGEGYFYRAFGGEVVVEGGEEVVPDLGFFRAEAGGLVSEEAGFGGDLGWSGHVGVDGSMGVKNSAGELAVS